MRPAVAARVRGLDLPPFDPLNSRAAELRAGGCDVISLGQAIPFFTPPSAAVAHAQAALDRGEVHGYSTDPGLPALRSVLAERLRTAAETDARPDDLIITAGANHAFTVAATTLVNAGDEVLLPAPYFTNQEMTLAAIGAETVEVPIADRERFSLRWSDLEPHVTARTAAVVLCNPSNPTGAPLECAEGRRIAAELRRRSIFLICDETYMRFVYAGGHWSAASADGWREHVVVVGTFSKSFGMMGWRVGYMLADAAICAEAIKVQDAMIICAPVISQVAAEAALRHDWGYPDTFHGELLSRRRALANGVSAIPRLRWTPTDGAFFGFLRVYGCEDSAALARGVLEEAHVVTIPGSAFGRSAEGHLRLSYGLADVAALREATVRLKRYFDRLDATHAVC